MTPRSVSALTAAAAATIALGGCGGSSKPPPTQQVIVLTRGRTTTTTTSTTPGKQKKPRVENSILAAATRYEKAIHSPVPPVSGAKPARGFMGNCMTNNGMGQPLLLRPNEWRGVVALRDRPLYVDGPYLSRSQAGISAVSLQGIETVAQGGLYVVSALKPYHLDIYVNALAKCLAKAGKAPSGQKPIPRLPGG